MFFFLVVSDCVCICAIAYAAAPPPLPPFHVRHVGIFFRLTKNTPSTNCVQSQNMSSHIKLLQAGPCSVGRVGEEFHSGKLFIWKRDFDSCMILVGNLNFRLFDIYVVCPCEYSWLCAGTIQIDWIGYLGGLSCNSDHWAHINSGTRSPIVALHTNVSCIALFFRHTVFASEIFVLNCNTWKRCRCYFFRRSLRVVNNIVVLKLCRAYSMLWANTVFELQIKKKQSRENAELYDLWNITAYIHWNDELFWCWVYLSFSFFLAVCVCVSMSLHGSTATENCFLCSC